MHDGHEFHLLVYFPNEVPEAFRDFCRERCQERATRYDTILARLGLPGLPPAAADAIGGERALTRLHVARALVDAGHVPSRAEAFSRYLRTRGAHVPSFSLEFTDAIALARSVGASRRGLTPLSTALTAISRVLWRPACKALKPCGQPLAVAIDAGCAQLVGGMACF